MKKPLQNHSWLLLICVSMIVMLVACGNPVKPLDDSHDEPSWISNTPLEQGFLYGVGSAKIFGGDTVGALSRAKDKARVELVKQVEVDVSGTVDQEISETIQGSASQLTMKLRQVVKNRVPQFKLSNAVALKSYTDGRRVSVLIRLNVTQELQALRRQIVSLDEQLAQYEIKLGETSATGMSMLRLISPALILVDQRAGLQSRFNRLDPVKNKGMLLKSEIREFVSEIYERIAHIKVSVQPKNEAHHSLKTALVSQLTQKGIQISENHSGDIQITYHFQTNSVERSGMVYVMTEGDLWISDENGQVVSAVQAKAKGVSGDPVEARSRSVKKLSDVLSKELLKALF